MNLSVKQLAIGATALIVFSFGVAFTIVKATDDDTTIVADMTETQRAAACIVWNNGSQAAALAETKQLFTQGADVTVFLETGITDPLRSSVETFIKGLAGTATLRYESKQDAYELFLKIFEGQTEVIEQTSPEALPESFRVTLRSGGSYDAFRDAVEGLNGVEQVRNERNFVAAPREISIRLDRIRAQGFYLDEAGKRVNEPPGCTS